MHVDDINLYPKCELVSDMWYNNNYNSLLGLNLTFKKIDNKLLSSMLEKLNLCFLSDQITLDLLDYSSPLEVKIGSLSEENNIFVCWVFLSVSIVFISQNVFKKIRAFIRSIKLLFFSSLL